MEKTMKTEAVLSAAVMVSANAGNRKTLSFSTRTRNRSNNSRP